MPKVYLTTMLRKNQTPWERKLWQVLRNCGLQSLKFRRQFKIGRYIVDFYCPRKKLVIELDGSQHGFENIIEQDKQRINKDKNF